MTMSSILEGLPGLTSNDLEERKNFLTASDIPALMGTSPWKTQADLYYEKTMDLEQDEPSDAMVWGHLMEVILVKWARHALSKRLGIPINTTRQGCRRKHKNGIMSCTLDSLVVGMGAAIECKTHALTYRRPNLDEWGPAWSSEIPPYHLDQVLAQLACAPDVERVYVVLCLGFMMPRIYVVERKHHLERIAAIEMDACDWWEEHIIPGIPPSELPQPETVKRMKIQKVAGITATGIPDHILERRKQVGSLLGQLEREKEQLDAQITMAMGSAIQGNSPKGHRVVIQLVNRGSYTVPETQYTKTNIYLAK